MKAEVGRMKDERSKKGEGRKDQTGMSPRKAA
jgi:hypothetical protein